MKLSRLIININSEKLPMKIVQFKIYMVYLYTIIHYMLHATGFIINMKFY